MDKYNKLLLPATIIIASLILGGFFYASQVNKQRSIERQQQIKIQEDRQAEEIKTEQEREAKTESEKQMRIQATSLDTCLDNAEEKRSRTTGELIKWAETENKNGKYDLTGAFESIDKRFEQDREECFKKYPQN